MARRRRRGRAARAGLVLAALVLAVVAAVYFLPQIRSMLAAPLAPGAARSEPSTARLRIVRAARDPQLGIEADALLLIRIVEMRQWREDCSGGTCRYAATWSEQPIPSGGFRDAAAHANPADLPFRSARFAAAEVRDGERIVSPEAAAAGRKPTDFPVRLDRLAPNMAASFRERGGVLYSGSEPPAIGDLRVRYRIIRAGD